MAVATANVGPNFRPLRGFAKKAQGGTEVPPFGTTVGAATFGAQLLQVGSGIVVGLGTFLAFAALLRMPELALIKETALRKRGGR